VWWMTRRAIFAGPYSMWFGFYLNHHSVYRACINPLFYRAIIAEFVGTTLLLYFALTTAVYRGYGLTDTARHVM